MGGWGWGSHEEVGLFLRVVKGVRGRGSGTRGEEEVSEEGEGGGEGLRDEGGEGSFVFLVGEKESVPLTSPFALKHTRRV